MTKKYFKYTLCASLCLVLSACGNENKINATNADTLSESLKTIAKGMTEQERQTFGQDILLIYGAKRDGEEKLNTAKLYAKEYPLLFSSDKQKVNFIGHIFQEIALKTSEELNGKSPIDVATQANKIRQNYYKAYKKKAEISNTELEARLAKVPDLIKAYNEKYEAVLLKQKNLATKRQNALSNFKVTKFEIDRNHRISVEGNIDVTNHLKEPINQVSFNPLINLTAVNAYLQINTNIKLEENLPSEKTVKNIPVSFSAFTFNIISTVENKKVDLKKLGKTPLIENPQANFIRYHSTGNQAHYDVVRLNLSGKDKNILRNHDRTLERCDSASQKLKEAIEKNALLIKAISKAAQKPKPVTGRLMSVYGGTTEC